MRFFMPTLIYSENDCVSRHSAELCALGKHALIITGKHSSAVNGSLDDVLYALREHGTAYTVSAPALTSLSASAAALRWMLPRLLP